MESIQWTRTKETDMSFMFSVLLPWRNENFGFGGE